MPAWAQVTSFNTRTGIVTLMNTDVTTALSNNTPLIAPSFESASGANVIVSSGGSGSTITFGDPSYGIGNVATMKFSSGANELVVSNILQSKFYNMPTQTFNVSGSVTPASLFTASWTGTMTGAPSYFVFNTPSDTADASGASNLPAAVDINDNFGGTNESGGRIALKTVLNVKGGVGGSNPNAVDGVFWSNITANMGGTSSTFNGSTYGLNPQAIVRNGATYLALVNALGEVDMSVEASSQLYTISGPVNAGDVITLTFTSSGIVGSPVSVQYTTGTSQSLTSVIYGLNAAVAANSSLLQAGVAISVNGTTFTILWPHTISLTIASNTTGGEFITPGSTTNGGSSQFKAGATFIREVADTMKALGESYVIGFGSQAGSTGTAPATAGWNYGLLFNVGHGTAWPFHPSATLIGVLPQVSNGASGKLGYQLPTVAQFGVDLKAVNFTQASGCSFRSPAFCINGLGSLLTGGARIVPSSSGLTIDVTGSVASAVSISPSGGGGGGEGSSTSNYYVGDVVFDSAGGQELVTAVNPTTGAVTAISVLVYPSTQTTVPSNPLSTTGGSGAGLQLSATWPSQSSIQIGATVNTIFGTGSTYSTTASGPFPVIPSSAGSPTGVAPSGALELDTTDQRLCVSLGGGAWHCS
jgi:hypothetical protein